MGSAECVNQCGCAPKSTPSRLGNAAPTRAPATIEKETNAALPGFSLIQVRAFSTAEVEATEALTEFKEGKEHPQGDKTFNGKLHQAYGHQNISKVEGGKLKVVHRTKIEEGLYEPEGDYTTMAL